jgi:hypothetical protein
MLINWTPVATAAVGVGGTVLGAGVGYLTAQLHSRVERARIAVERERFFYARVDEQLDRRRTVYHHALATMYRFRHERSGLVRLSVESRRDWLSALNEHVTAVSLSGTKEAYCSADALASMIHEYLDAEERPWDNATTTTFDEMWAAALDVMRNDLTSIEARTPDSEPDPYRRQERAPS